MLFSRCQSACFARPEALQGRMSLAAASAAAARSLVCTRQPKQQQKVQQPRAALQAINLRGLSMLLEQQRSMAKTAATIKQLAPRHRLLEELEEAALGRMSTTDFLHKQQGMPVESKDSKSPRVRGLSYGLSYPAHNSSVALNAHKTINNMLAACWSLDAQLSDVALPIFSPMAEPQPEEQQAPLAATSEPAMYAVYRQTPYSAVRKRQLVEVLRLPEQAAACELHVLRGHQLVRLPGSRCDVISAEQQDSQPAEEEAAYEVASEDAPITNSNTIKVEVRITVATRPGQDVVLAGSHPALGSWSLDGAVRLSWTDGHVWCGSIDMPANANFEYKAVVRSADGCMWEEGDNLCASVQGGTTLVLQHDFRR